MSADTTQCDEACCIDGACFDLKHQMPPDSLALWLDWTSLYEDESSPIWRDRSSHAYSFSSEGSNPKLVGSSQLHRNVLRLSAPGQHMVVSGQEELTLERNDFLLLVAGSLSCEPIDTDAEQCLVTRVDDLEGMRLCATRSSEQPSHFNTSQKDGTPPSLSAHVTGVACNQMQLFTLRRFTPDATDAGSFASQFELRQNAVTQAQIELDASLSLEVASALRIGGRKKNSFIGDVALVAVIVGKVGARERCELERFVLAQLAAADMPTAAEPQDCSGL